MTPQKILIIQLRRIGDVVFTLPVAGVLKNNFPEAQIDFLVEEPSNQLARLNPFVHETLVYNSDRALEWVFKIRKKKYDCVLDFHANGRSLILTLFSGAKLKAGFDGPLNRKLVYNKIIQTDRNQFMVDQKIDLLRSLEIKDKRWNWDLKIPAPDRGAAELLLLKKGIKNSDLKIGLAPLHRHPIRAWEKKYFIETANALVRKHRASILLLGGPAEERELNSFSEEIQGKTAVIAAENLIQLSSCIQTCGAFIANDNGPQKIAMALNIPCVTIFGPTNPRSINTNQFPQFALRDENLFCIGCERKRCPYLHECMRNITPAMVLEKMDSLLQNKSCSNPSAKK